MKRVCYVFRIESIEVDSDHTLGEFCSNDNIPELAKCRQEDLFILTGRLSEGELLDDDDDDITYPAPPRDVVKNGDYDISVVIYEKDDKFWDLILGGYTFDEKILCTEGLNFCQLKLLNEATDAN